MNRGHETHRWGSYRQTVWGALADGAPSRSPPKRGDEALIEDESLKLLAWTRPAMGMGA